MIIFEWSLFIVLGAMMVGFFACMGLSLLANNRACKQRLKLIYRWKISGDHSLACDEFVEVDYDTHYRACKWFQNPKKLYGPLTQGVWDDDNPKIYDSFWWRCYNEIYLKLEAHSQARIKHIMATSRSQVSMTVAMCMCNMDIDAWLSQSPPPADKFTMKDGAEEYELIMAMQDLING